MWDKPKTECPDQFADKVTCDTCACWLNERDAQKVTLLGSWSSCLYFCRAHRKPYTKIVYSGCYGLSADSQTKYLGEVEMTEEGVPIGFVAAKKKK